MNKYSKTILIFSICLAFFSFISPSNAAQYAPQDVPQETQDINIYLFYSDTCPHCHEEISFLESIKQQYTDIVVHGFEVTKNQDNAQLLTTISNQFKLDVPGVPFTLIGNSYFPGFLNEDSTGKDMLTAIECVRQNECPDILSETIFKKEQVNGQQLQQKNEIPTELKLPLVGTIQTKNLSLPVLTIIIAGLDGFNPCAMWVLLFLISLLLGMNNRKKMWALGTTFIVSSGIVYFLFLSAWLNLFLFIGVIVWVRIIIGIVALFSGGYNLKEYYYNKKGICKITRPKERQQIFHKLKNVISQKNFLFAIGGIILMAFAVNLIELICSAGLPAIYTQVLSLANLASYQYYLYLLLYIIIFLLDDMIIFIIAMITLKTTGISGKYSRFSHLIGGILMLILGLLLIFKPEILMFA